MTKINLTSRLREEVGKKVKKLRKGGNIPAVIYGNKIESKNIWVDFLSFRNAYNNAGENTIIELDIDGKEKSNVLIHDIQTDPMSGNFTHVDFFQVNMDEEIETEIPLEFVGIAPAVKELGGILLKTLDEIPVKCLPSDLPSKYEIDLSVLKTFDDYIKVENIKVSEKVEIMLDKEVVIASVTEPRSEEDLAKLNEKVEEDVSQVQGVEKKEEAVVEGEGEKKEKK